MAGVPTLVLDTNVLEAAMRSRRGASSRLLSLVGTGRFEIAISVPLVLEYEDVLMRTAGTPDRPVGAVQHLIDYLCTVGQRQSIFFLWRPFLADARDDMVLELALAASCDAIVTHNWRDFQPARELGIRVLRPSEFLQELGEA
jgi:predicted nucleic acid-binding protein